jgi:hypothetical protein
MIRNHQPRGAFWNCPSAFQQSEKYRSIDFEESGFPWLHDYAPIICSKASHAERESKRFRIEKLAENFLNGSPLFIASARPTYVTPSGLEISETEPLWEDVLGDREIMERYAGEQGLVDRGIVQNGLASDLESHVVVEVQASCRPRATPIRNRLLAQPSEEALRLAAELRDRGQERNVVCETQALQQSVSIDDSFHEQSRSSTSEQESQGLHPTAAWTSGKWLETGTFMPRRKGVDEDCSRDELGASSSNFPSSRTRPRAQNETIQVNRSRSGDSAATVSSYYTPEDLSNVGGAVAVPSSHLAIQDYSGPAKVVEARNSRNARHSTTGLSVDEENGSQPPKRRSLRNAQRRSIEARSESTSHSTSQENATSKIFSARSLPTAAEYDADKSSTHRKSMPLASESVAIGQPEVKVPAQYENLVGSESSPFAFRKRLSRKGQEKGQRAGTTQVVATPLRTESESTASSLHKVNKGPSGQSVIPLTPNTASHNHTTTPLTDSQINRVLRTNTSERNMKELLRDEMELAGAVFTSLEENEVSTALHPAKGNVECNQTSSAELAEVLLKSIRKETQDSQCWAGTQVLLARAQQDLFTSPDKGDLESQPDNPTPASRPRTSSGTTTKKKGRNSLLPLSQGRVPSTQALLDTWQGWSTIKKPRTSSTSKRNSLLLQSPSLGKLKNPSAVSGTGKGSTRRRSGLHVSTVVQASCYDLPTDSVDATAPDVQASEVQQAPESEIITSTVSFIPTSFLAEAVRANLPKPRPTSDSPGADLSLPSGRETQDPSFDQSELDLTITQLAEEVLGTAGSISF